MAESDVNLFFSKELWDNNAVVISCISSTSVVISVTLRIMLHNSSALIPSSTYIFQLPSIFSYLEEIVEYKRI